MTALIDTSAGHTPVRAMSSRANWRYAAAPADEEAYSVMGCPAAVVSENLMARPMVVENTRSANAD
ncbi:MAG: hypothetical protein EBS41_06585 [Actinobacteria bacterium]|nr:hypothetical protein [Actinomycetota bacterium]